MNNFLTIIISIIIIIIGIIIVNRINKLIAKSDSLHPFVGPDFISPLTVKQPGRLFLLHAFSQTACAIPLSRSSESEAPAR